MPLDLARSRVSGRGKFGRLAPYLSCDLLILNKHDKGPSQRARKRSTNEIGERARVKEILEDWEKDPGHGGIPGSAEVDCRPLYVSLACDESFTNSSTAQRPKAGTTESAKCENRQLLKHQSPAG